MYFAVATTPDGKDYELEAETLEALANDLPLSFEGTTNATNKPGFTVGYIGRDLFSGTPHWKAI